MEAEFHRHVLRDSLLTHLMIYISGYQPVVLVTVGGTRK
jgi:hypothetical protein